MVDSSILNKRPDQASPSLRPDHFATTHWSVVVNAAADGGRSPEASRALAVLCENYWFPLYAYVRRRGHDQCEAEDLTQEFFLRLLAQAQKSLADVHPAKGRFRAFLLASLKHFLANEWTRQQRQKRGQGQTVISLDAVAAADAESRYQLELVDELTPERLFEQRWALAVLDKVLARLQAEFIGP